MNKTSPNTQRYSRNTRRITKNMIKSRRNLKMKILMRNKENSLFQRNHQKTTDHGKLNTIPSSLVTQVPHANEQ